MLARTNRQPSVRNQILTSLSPQDLAAIGRFLEPVVLRQRMVLQEPRKAVERVYFIETGIVSQRVIAAGSMFETAVVGCRGAVGASSVFGANVPAHQSVVLFPGSALSIAVNDLRRVMDEQPPVRERLAAYAQALVMHRAQSGFCGVRHDLEERLASWLCLTCDASNGQVLPVTHDYLSTALGLPRAGVTRALIRFEKDGLLRKMRGILQLHDRMRLGQRACSCYAIIARGYASGEFPAHLTRVRQVSIEA